MHIKAKLGEANRCLYVIRGLRKEGCSQEEIDFFFKAVALSKVSLWPFGISATTAELNIIQCFLDICTWSNKYSRTIRKI